ncbi:hypothetical protein MCOR14_012020, partial [Pyricularia oryzae]
IFIPSIQVPILADFGKAELLTWIAIGYTAVNSCVVPLCRRLDMFGYARWHIYMQLVSKVIGGTRYPNQMAKVIARGKLYISVTL